MEQSQKTVWYTEHACKRGWRGAEREGEEPPAGKGEVGGQEEARAWGMRAERRKAMAKAASRGSRKGMVGRSWGRRKWMELRWWLMKRALPRGNMKRCESEGRKELASVRQRHW